MSHNKELPVIQTPHDFHQNHSEISNNLDQNIINSVDANIHMKEN